MFHVSHIFHRLGSIFPVIMLMLFWGNQVFALSNDKDQPIDIAADSVDMNEAKGISIYKGDVELNQGSIRLLADKVTIYNRAKKPHKVVAIGRQVKFRQLPDNSKHYIQGRANRAEYLVDSEELTLIGNAELKQAKDTFRSDRIIYDRVRSVVKAGAAAKGKERVKITIDSAK